MLRDVCRIIVVCLMSGLGVQRVPNDGHPTLRNDENAARRRYAGTHCGLRLLTFPGRSRRAATPPGQPAPRMDGLRSLQDQAAPLISSATVSGDGTRPDMTSFPLITSPGVLRMS